MITGKLHMACTTSAANCLQRFSHSCLTIKSHLRPTLNWIDIECGHFWSIKLTLLGVNTEYGRLWSSALVVKPMRCSSNHPLWPACKIHFRIKMAMKISTNRKLEHFANQEISQFVLHLRNRSHLCDKWPRQVKGIHLCNSTSLQFSGDRAFVCVEPLPPLWDLFCAILTHSPHLSGGHISEQATQLAPLLSTGKPAKCFFHRLVAPPAVAYF